MFVKGRRERERKKRKKTDFVHHNYSKRSSQMFHGQLSQVTTRGFQLVRRAAFIEYGLRDTKTD